MNLRKLLLIAAIVSPMIIFQGCSKDKDDGEPEIVNGGSNNNNNGNNNGVENNTDLSKLDWKVKWDYLSDDFFPSWTYMQLINNNYADLPECISISIPKESEGARIKLTVEDNEFINQTIVEETVTADIIKDENYAPKLKWKQDALINAIIPGFFNLNAVLEINDKVVQRFNKRIKYHSINDCVNTVNGIMYSIYVNEDNPNIDKILKQCLALGNNRQFVGNQWSKGDVLNQMWWVWQYFSMRGITYSDITTNSSNEIESINGTKFSCQHVRFFDQCYNEKQANCVDGSCLLASIYRKIGLDVALVLEPNHCFLAVRPKTNDVKGHEDENIIYLETTCMGNTQINDVEYNPKNVDDNWNLFQYAIKCANKKVEDYKNEHGTKDAMIVYIDDARAKGYKPIQRTEEINDDVLDAPEVTDFTPTVDKVSFNKSEHKYIGYYNNENDANDQTDYDYRYTIGFTVSYPNVESTKETGIIIGDASYFSSNGNRGQGCKARWPNSQSTSSGSMYYYSNSTSVTVSVQGYCIDKHGNYHWSTIKGVDCVYSAMGTK
ncbi:MAG: hypothetical protein J6Y24_10960 [Bacteroidales bacterium]|nr:hypothetical protein [Bacteroidales bacterium]